MCSAERERSTRRPAGGGRALHVEIGECEIGGGGWRERKEGIAHTLS
jgi:hypothetical protein